jgi:vitamin K epoxide reductase family protein
MSPDALRRQWRQGPGSALARRRGVAALALLSAGSMGVIALYQLGLIEHLPDPPLPGLDSEAVVGSDEAYARLATPDAVLGLGSYAVTLGLAAMGGEDRAARRPWLPLALGAKVTFDALQAGRLALGQWPRHRALCSWCLLAAGATVAAVPLAAPEVREAWRHLTRKAGGPGRPASLRPWSPSTPDSSEDRPC